MYSVKIKLIILVSFAKSLFIKDADYIKWVNSATANSKYNFFIGYFYFEKYLLYYRSKNYNVSKIEMSIFNIGTSKKFFKLDIIE